MATAMLKAANLHCLQFVRIVLPGLYLPLQSFDAAPKQKLQKSLKIPQPNEVQKPTPKPLHILSEVHVQKINSRFLNPVEWESFNEMEFYLLS